MQQFSTRAKKTDTAFTNILKQAAALQKGGTNEFMGLQLAAGTNDLKKYFPFIGAQNQVHPNLFILNRLQRDAAGKIKLGLDLQGGTEFKVSLNTNHIELADTNAAKSSSSERQRLVSRRGIVSLVTSHKFQFASCPLKPHKGTSGFVYKDELHEQRQERERPR